MNPFGRAPVYCYPSGRYTISAPVIQVAPLVIPRGAGYGNISILTEGLLRSRPPILPPICSEDGRAANA